MNTTRTADLQDSKVDTKIVLSGLWISTLFVFAYVDNFGFWRADVINGALAGKIPGAGPQIDQIGLDEDGPAHRRTTDDHCGVFDDAKPLLRSSNPKDTRHSMVSALSQPAVRSFARG